MRDVHDLMELATDSIDEGKDVVYHYDAYGELRYIEVEEEEFFNPLYQSEDRGYESEIEERWRE